MSSILDELKNKYPDTEGVQKANNIAEGVAAMPTGESGGGVFIVGGVTFGEDHRLTGTLDKTWQEIHDAMQNKICIVVVSADDGVEQYFVGGVYAVNGAYHVGIDGNDFSTTTANGYPRVPK